MNQTKPTHLSDKQIAALYNVHPKTPWRWAREGTFPKPVKLTSGCTRWRVADLEAWEAARQSEGAV